MAPTYQHRDLDYFRLGQCQVCGIPTYHKPVSATRRSGRSESLWQCEQCRSETAIIERVENELELFAEYVRRTYLDGD